MRYTVKKTVETVLAQGCDLLVQVKDNQPSLATALRAVTLAHPARDTHRTEDVGRHNRIETRTTRVWPFPVEHVDADSAWRFGQTLIEVTRVTDVYDTRSKSWLPRREVSLYFCTRAMTAPEAGFAVRAHWGIENRWHHVRDRTLQEDASRIRCQAGSFARLRSLALNILRKNGEENIAQALFRNAINPRRVLKYQALF